MIQARTSNPADWLREITDQLMALSSAIATYIVKHPQLPDPERNSLNSLRIKIDTATDQLTIDAITLGYNSTESARTNLQTVTAQVTLAVQNLQKVHTVVRYLTGFSQMLVALSSSDVAGFLTSLATLQKLLPPTSTPSGPPVD